MSSEPRRQVIFDALERYGGHALPEASTAATIGALSALLTELDPLIGDRGVQALYRRSFRLAAADFAWLAGVAGALDPSPLARPAIASLQAAFEGRSADEIRGAGLAMLTILTDLLATLIGEHLLHRILLAAWQENSARKHSPDSKR